MAIDILGSLSSIFGSQVARQVSTLLGDSEVGTRAGLQSSSSALLAALLHKTTTPADASELHRTVMSDSVDPSLSTRFASLLNNRGSLDPALAKGQSVVGSILGNRSDGVAHAIASVAGINPASATSLLALVAPMLLSVLKKFVGQGGLDAGGLSSLLSSQRGALQQAGLDSRITNAMGFGSLQSMLPDTGPSRPLSAETIAPAASHTPAYRASIPPRSRRWIPWAIGAAVAVLALSFLSTRFGNRDSKQTAPTALTTSVYFDVGGAALQERDRATIVTAASTAKASDLPLILTGYADPSGNPEQNLALAKERAAAVRSALVQEGVQESRIHMAAPTSVTGTGSPEDARRVDIKLAAVETEVLR